MKWKLGIYGEIYGSWFTVERLGFRIQDIGFRVQDLEFRVRDLLFQALGSFAGCL